MNLRKLIAPLPGLRIVRLDGDPCITDVVFDSREVAPGALFVALPGARVDGHDYLDEARTRGAVAALVATGRDAPGGYTAVLSADDPRAALGPIARRFFEDPTMHLRVVGVTGTNGKTTTTYLLEAMFDHAGYAPGVLGTIEYRWRGVRLPAANTTPESLVIQRHARAMRQAGVDVALLEVSSHGLATHRLDGVRFDAAIFTNLTQDHLDFHGTMQAYRDAKAKLFLEHLPAGARTTSRVFQPKPMAIVNVDDPEGTRLREELASHPVDVCATSCAGRPGADVRVAKRAHTLDGSTFTLADSDVVFSLRLFGDYNISNALGAVALGRAWGLDDERIAEGLANAIVPGRLEPIRVDDVGAAPSVFVDYAHSPDAISRSLAMLRPLTPGRLIIVFGAGGDRDAAKRPLMGAAAAEHADLVILTSDNPRSEDPDAIVEAIARGIPPHTAQTLRIPARDEAIRVAVAQSHPGDVVLIAGKGHETTQEAQGILAPFDDREHARRALQALDTGERP